MTHRLLTFPSSSLPSPHPARSDRSFLREMGIRPARIQQLRIRTIRTRTINQPRTPTILDTLKAGGLVLSLLSLSCGLWMVGWMMVTGMMRWMR